MYGYGIVFWPSRILFPLSDLVSIDNIGLFPNKLSSDGGSICQLKYFSFFPVILPHFDPTSRIPV